MRVKSNGKKVRHPYLEPGFWEQDWVKLATKEPEKKGKELSK